MFLPPITLLRLLAACLLVAAGATFTFAQTCKVTCPDGTSMKVSCDTKADPCPLRDFAAPPALGTPEWSAAFTRFTDVVTRLRVQEPSLLKDQPLPVTYSDLLDQTNDLFGDAAFKLDTINLRNRWLAEQTRKADQEMQALLSSHDELLIRGALLRTEKQTAQAENERVLHATEAKRLPSISIQRAAAAMRDRAQRAAQDSLYWLTIAEPPGLNPIGERSLASRVTAAQEPLVWAPVSPESAVLIAPAAGSQPDVFDQVATRRPLPGGTVNDRLSAAEGLIPQLADAVELSYQSEADLAFRNTLVTNLRSQVAGLMTAVTKSQGELNALRASTASLKALGPRDLQANQTRAVGNLQRAAAEAFVLETFRDEVVIPEVQRFLSANRIAPSLDHAALVRIYNTKSSLLPRVNNGAYADLDRFVQVQRRGESVLRDYRTYADGAASILTSGRARSLNAEVVRYAGRYRRELSRGPDREAGALAKIARVVLGR